ncbi:AfsR/SARP family transcriptional regulator [Streptomyces montanisoli]|uniref:Tetratricopeptide repeat protein n=1 Tax=Streptomyces montanisoli TaxID=2798581 RepID=A0A940MFQ0_9ACTN|nr:BTAD domain-containing putative transcriptional regulator [Streptomyces montanisoli]MBP0458772.1 tetratricopeptide repeat protein [Streptomyces montanisoli]
MRVLVVALLLRAGRVVENERLAEWLWGGKQPANPRATLHTYVRRLRVLLGDHDIVVTSPHGYRIDVGEDELDLGRFRRLARAAHDTAGLEERARLLAECMDAWRGSPLADVPSDALRQDELAPLEDERLTVLESYFETELGLGRHAQLVKELRTAAMDNPLRENFWGLLMLALYRSGRQAEALAVYGQARRELVEQLGIEPGERLRALHSGILESDPGLANPDGFSAQAGHSFTAPAQLPPLSLGFVGRSDVVARVEALLPPDPARTGVPVVVLSGPPGVGKTALAVCLGRRVRERFPHGQLYVNMRGHEHGGEQTPLTPQQVLPQFLRSLGVPAGQIPVELTELVNLYRSKLAGRNVLVVLDNAAAIEQVLPLIPGDAGCSVLITSRRKLRGLAVSHGGQVIQLSTLSPAESRELVTEMLRQAAVPVEPDVVREVTALCAYLPLALRIAAANLISAPGGHTGAYLERLRQGDRLAALSVEGDTASAVSTAIALSYDTMAIDDRAVFRLCGLFPGSDFSPEAIAALTDISTAQARAGLGRLEAANLLQQHAPGRYQLHDLLRDYARERAHAEHTAPERAEALERLGQWYLAKTCAAADVLHTEFIRLAPPAGALAPSDVDGFADESQAMAWLLSERRNLMTCVRFFATEATEGLEASGGMEAAEGPHYLSWYLADALRGFFWTGKYRGEWDEATRHGLAAAEARGDRHGIASMHRSLANLHNTVGDYRLAIAHQEKSLAVHAELGMREDMAATLNNMSLAHLSLGQVHAADDAARRALEIARQIGSPRLEASTLGLLGSICWTLGEMREATAFITASLASADEQGLHHIRSYGLRNLGLVRQASGELAGSRDCFTKALKVSEAIDSSYDRSISLYGLALVDEDLGRCASAFESAQQALAAFKECGDRTYEIETLCVLSAISTGLGQPREAARYAGMALEGARGIGYTGGEAYALALTAVADCFLGNEGAVDRAEAAMALVDAGSSRVARGKVLLALGPLYLRLGDPDRARECAERALAVSEPSGQRLNAARARQVLGDVAELTGDHAGARAHHAAAHAAFAEAGVPLPGSSPSGGAS